MTSLLYKKQVDEQTWREFLPGENTFMLALS